MPQKITYPSASESKKFTKPNQDYIENYDKTNPLFSFEYLDSEYCISKCSPDEKSAFVDEIRIIGKQTWNEIKQRGRHRGGTELIPITQVQGNIPRIVTQDVEKIMVFHFHDNIPIAGHRVKNIFYIIWIDREFKLYKHS